MMHTRIGDQPLSPSTINHWIDASNSKIDLRSPRQPRAHRQARTRIIVACVALAVVVALALRYLWRASYGL
jgi:hypothetical protein